MMSGRTETETNFEPTQLCFKLYSALKNYRHPSYKEVMQINVMQNFPDIQQEKLFLFYFSLELLLK